MKHTLKDIQQQLEVISRGIAGVETGERNNRLQSAKRSYAKHVIGPKMKTAKAYASTAEQLELLGKRSEADAHYDECSRMLADVRRRMRGMPG